MNGQRMLKNIEESSLLFISSDENAIGNLFENIKNNFKSSSLVNSLEDAVKIMSISKIDIIVLDANLTKINFRSCCFGLDAQFQNIPKIVISNNPNKDLLNDCINFGAYVLLSKNIDWQNLVLILQISINGSKCCNKLVFPDGSYYHETKGSFYKKDHTVIELTKLELGVMQLMMEKKGEIVDCDMIRKVVWSDKPMSVFTMRNIISKIRLKMYHDVIKNYSNKGYSLDTSKVCS